MIATRVRRLRTRAESRRLVEASGRSAKKATSAQISSPRTTAPRRARERRAVLGLREFSKLDSFGSDFATQ